MMKDRIKSRRKELKLTQADIAKTIGVSKVTVSQWESGDTKPNGVNLTMLSEALNKSPNWILHSDYGTKDFNKEIHFKPYTAPMTAPLFDRVNLRNLLNDKEECTDLGYVPTIGVPELYREGIIAFSEDMNGLEPMISKGDRLYISGIPKITQGSNSMFWVNDMPVVGMVSMSPMGIKLQFISSGPGWETVSVSEDDYIGQVVAIDPTWAYQSRVD